MIWWTRHRWMLQSFWKPRRNLKLYRRLLSCPHRQCTWGESVLSLYLFLSMWWWKRAQWKAEPIKLLGGLLCSQAFSSFLQALYLEAVSSKGGQMSCTMYHFLQYYIDAQRVISLNEEIRSQSMCTAPKKSKHFTKPVAKRESLHHLWSVSESKINKVHFALKLIRKQRTAPIWVWWAENFSTLQNTRFINYKCSHLEVFCDWSLWSIGAFQMSKANACCTS